MESAALGRATVGGGCVGWRYRIDWLVGVEPMESETGIVRGSGLAMRGAAV